MENVDDDMIIEKTVRPISRMEKAFFHSLKWLLTCAILGTVLSYTIEDKTGILRQTVLFMCICYISGTLYRWYRYKTTTSQPGVDISG
jgi:hypothetical protein